MGIQSTVCGLAISQYLIMRSLILVALTFGAAVVVNAQGSPPPPPPPPPSPPRATVPLAHYPRPPVHGYRPSYGPSHGGGLGGLGSLLPFLLLGKHGGHGKDNLLPLLLLGGGLGGKGGKGGLGGNPLLLSLLLGKGDCDKPHGCVKPNTGNTLCGKGQGKRKCCVCSGGLFHV